MSDLSVAGELSAAAPAVAAPAAPAAPAVAAPAAAPVAAAPAPGVAAPAVAAPAAPAAVVPPAEEALKLPGKDAKPEEWKAFYAKLGAPENADGYKLEVPDGQDPSFSKLAAGKFSELGLLPQQAEGLAKWWNEQAGAATKAAEKAEADAVIAQQAKARDDDNALKNEFQGEGYAKMKETAGRAAREFFPGDAKQREAALSALEGVLGYGGLYRMLNKIGTGLAEGALRGADGGGQPPAKPLANLMFDDVLKKAGLIKDN